MAKKSEARVVMDMACTVCQNRNYTTSKNKRNDTQRMELKKFCSHCRKVTLHRETKYRAALLVSELIYGNARG